MKEKHNHIKYPGVRHAMDGNTAVIMCERESSDAAGAYPITPSTQMGEYWAEETAKGYINVSGRPLIFVEPEGLETRGHDKQRIPGSILTRPGVELVFLRLERRLDLKLRQVKAQADESGDRPDGDADDP